MEALDTLREVILTMRFAIITHLVLVDERFPVLCTHSLRAIPASFFNNDRTTLSIQDGLR